MIYSLDIETAPYRAEEYTDKKVYNAPANWKDQDKIAAKVAEMRAADIKKAALHWWTGRVVCISVTDVISGKPQSFFEPEEKNLLRDFATYMSGKSSSNFAWHIIGKNVLDFDLPFLRGRMMYHDLGLPAWLRPNHSIEDIDHIFGRSRASGQHGKLSDYAFGLDIKGKLDDISGEEVPQMYIDGHIERIVEYCEQDTQIVAEIYRRFEREFVA